MLFSNVIYLILDSLPSSGAPCAISHKSCPHSSKAASPCSAKLRGHWLDIPQLFLIAVFDFSMFDHPTMAVLTAILRTLQA